jgi:lipopolysaccharide/colanic/teichoic acid biosynthesis glycosyltransferase
MSDYRRLRSWVLFADSLWLIASVAISCFLRYGFAWRLEPRSTLESFALILLGSWIIWPSLCRFTDLGKHQSWRVSAIASHLVLMVTIMMLVLSTAGYLIRVFFSRLALSYFAATAFAGFLLIRIALRAFVKTTIYGGTVRRIWIVGNGRVAQEAAATFAQHPELRCEVVGFLTPDDTSLDVLSGIGGAAPIYLASSGVLDTLRSQKVDEIVFAHSRNGDPRIAELMQQCARHGLAISIIPQPYELYSSAAELIDLEGIPIVRLRNSLDSPKLKEWKRLMDLALGCPLLVIAGPILLSAGALLKMKKGAAFCREERYGLHGQRFWIYRLNSPRKATALPSYERVLQHLSVTELPQLLNVIRGDMSLVGPRPEGIESVRHYTDWHWQRLKVKPGMTGLAQVHGLRDEHGLEDKTRYDLQYILHRSVFQDLSLLLQTLWTLTCRLGHLHELTDRSSGRLEGERPASKSAAA